MKSLKVSALLLGAALSMASCAKKPNSDEAQVSEAKAETKQEASSVYNMNLEESQVTWIGTKPTGQHNGTLAIKEGAVKLNDGQVVGGTFTIDMNAVDVLDLEGEWEQKLIGHLQSGDFFDVENHPTATFTITSIEKMEAVATEEKDVEVAEASMETKEADETKAEESLKIENPTHKVTGNLTMRGTTKSITFPALIEVSEGTVSAKANFNINRTDWGITYKEESSAASIGKDKIIFDEVNVGFDVTAIK